MEIIVENICIKINQVLPLTLLKVISNNFILGHSFHFLGLIIIRARFKEYSCPRNENQLMPLPCSLFLYRPVK